MGGFTHALEEGFEKVAPKLRDMPLLRSFEAVLQKTPSGKVLADTLRTDYEPMRAQLHSQYRQAGYTADEARHMSKTDARQQTFGKQHEALVKAVHNIYKESNAGHVNHVVDGMNVYFGEEGTIPWRGKAQKAGVPVTKNSAYQAPRSGERQWKELASWVYLPRVVLPHLGQPLNTLLAEGVKPTLKAASTLISMGREKAMQHVMSSGAMEEEIWRQMAEDAKGGGWFRKAFHMPGFNFVRRIQVTHAALAGEYALKDAAEDYLKGDMGKDTLLTLEKHGLKDPTLLKEMGVTPDMIDKARFISAQRAMFIHSGLDTPYTWNQNFTSRMAFMYKNYAFNQGRFLTNHIKDAFFKGGPQTWLRTLVTLGAVYPLVGEAIKNVESLAVGREFDDKNELIPGNEYVEAMSHVAGFGIYSSMMRAVKRRALAGYIVGPVASSITDLIQDIYQQETRKHATGVNFVGRDITSKIPVIGAPLANEYFPAGRQPARKKPTGY